MAKIQAADVSFEVARLRAIAPDNWPYLGMALWGTRGHKTEACPTAAIDEWWRIYINPEFFKSLSAQQAAAVLVHEVWHVLRFHFLRARGKGVTRETADLWNMVADAEIHCDEVLLASLTTGTKLDPVTVKSFDPPLDPRGTAETWYDDIMTRPTTKKHQFPDGTAVYLPLMQDGYPQPGPGTFGNGSGSSGLPAPWEFPGPYDEEAAGKTVHPGNNQEEAGIIQRAVAEAAQKHCQARGTGAGGLLRWCESLLDPKVDWQTKFMYSFQGVMAPVCGSIRWTWSRTARRQASDPRILLPGWAGSQRRVAVLVDTSGSMSTTMLARCRGEVTNMISTLVTNSREPSVYVYTCDTQVSEAQRVWSGADIEMIGGGGTDITVAFDRVLEDMESGEFEFDIVICMTDGYTPWPDKPFPVPVVTMLVGDGAHPAWLDEAPHSLVKIDPE